MGGSTLPRALSLTARESPRAYRYGSFSVPVRSGNNLSVRYVITARGFDLGREGRPIPVPGASVPSQIWSTLNAVGGAIRRRFGLISSGGEKGQPPVSIFGDRLGMAKLGGALLAFVFTLSLYAASADASSAEEDFVRKTVSSHEIVIFSKSYCPYCKRAKGVFKELNKVPHVVELDQRDDGMDIQDALSLVVGRRTVPQVFINGKHIGGSDDTVEAHERGTLSKLLGIASKEDL